MIKKLIAWVSKKNKFIFEWIRVENRNEIDPTVWIRKYFIIDSFERIEFSLCINGIKAIRLISRPIQAEKILDEEAARKVPEINKINKIEFKMFDI